MKPLLLLSVLLLAACSAPPEEPPVGTGQAALADCSTNLGACYQRCQSVTPTPTVQCFVDCETTFNRCIAPQVEVIAY